MNQGAGRGLIGLRLLGTYKLAKAMLLVAAAGGILGMVHSEVGSSLVRWATALGLDANNHYVREAIARLSGVGRRGIRLVGVGTLLYAGLNVIEGVGLWMGLRWAECLTIVATTLLLPVEAVEIVREPSPLRFVVVGFSLAIILYLVQRLETDHASKHHHPV